MNTAALAVVTYVPRQDDRTSPGRYHCDESFEDRVRSGLMMDKRYYSRITGDVVGWNEDACGTTIASICFGGEGLCLNHNVLGHHDLLCVILRRCRTTLYLHVLLAISGMTGGW